MGGGVGGVGKGGRRGSVGPKGGSFHNWQLVWEGCTYEVSIKLPRYLSFSLLPSLIAEDLTPNGGAGAPDMPVCSTMAIQTIQYNTDTSRGGRRGAMV